jgi:hypothetical protein
MITDGNDKLMMQLRLELDAHKHGSSLSTHGLAHAFQTKAEDISDNYKIEIIDPDTQLSPRPVQPSPRFG